MTTYAREVKRQFIKGTKGGKILRAFLAHYEFAPAVGANAAILAATTLGDNPQVVSTNITTPDVPRVLSIKGNAASVAGNVIIEGVDANGQPLTETIVAAGTSVVAGTKAFYRVFKITLPARAANGNTISVGTTNVLGLWHALPFDLRLATLFDGAADAGTLATDANDVAKNLFTPAGTLDGARVLRIIYVL